MSFETLLLLSIVSHNLNIIKATSTSTSSFESGWSNNNVQADSALVSIEQYRSLQARFNEMQREHSNLGSNAIYWKPKTRRSSTYYYTISLDNLLIHKSGRHMNTWLHGSLLPLANMLYWSVKTTPTSCTGSATSILLHWQKEELPPSTMPLLRLQGSTCQTRTLLIPRSRYPHWNSSIFYETRQLLQKSLCGWPGSRLMERCERVCIG